MLHVRNIARANVHFRSPVKSFVSKMLPSLDGSRCVLALFKKRGKDNIIGHKTIEEGRLERLIFVVN